MLQSLSLAETTLKAFTLSLRELQQQQASQQQQQQSAAAAVAETARLAADRERHLQEEQRRQIQDALNR